MSDEYEFELTTGREDAAAVLRGVADGVRAGSVRVSDGAGGATVEVPEELALEVEVESEADELSLEVELTWPTPAGEDPAFDRIEATTDEGPSAAATTDVGGEAASVDASDAAESGGDGVADDSADAGGSLARFELFRDSADEWRWRLRHRNGNIIATSGEGYTRKHNARKGLRSVAQNALAAPVTEAAEE